MKFAKIEFETPVIADRAFVGMARRGKVICLANDQFIVPEPALEWLRTQGFTPVVLQWLNQADASFSKTALSG